MTENFDLLTFQIKVQRCSTLAVPFEEMAKVFTSNIHEEGRFECLVQQLGYISQLKNEQKAYELALVLVEAGVLRDSRLLISRAAETYLAREDADLRVVTHFESKSDYLRTFNGQLSMRQVILEAHGIKVDSCSLECDKIIQFLAKTRRLDKIDPHALNRLPRSPSVRKLSASDSTTPQNSQSKRKRRVSHDGTQSE